MTDLATIRDGWERAAQEDAMFNILTDPAGRNGGWNVEDFFRHGRREIDEMLSHLDELGLRGKRRQKALDFGCGVGRLTQALIPAYKKVWGVDISMEMIRQAREYNQWGARCTYVRTDEQVIPYIHADSCDLIYSRITLQHMPAEHQRSYVEQFVRLLALKGLAVFQIPEGPEYHHPSEWLSMYGVPRATVEEWITDVGGDLLDVERLSDESDQWTAYRYTMRRA